MASIYSCWTLTASKSRSQSAIKPFRFKYYDQSQISLFLRNKSRIGFSTSRGSSGSVIRASVDFSPLSVRPGGIIETDKLPSDVRKRTMDAVDECGGRVTIGDVASKAGINLNQAQKALQALAADTNGFLEVLVCCYMCSFGYRNFEVTCFSIPSSNYGCNYESKDVDFTK